MVIGFFAVFGQVGLIAKINDHFTDNFLTKSSSSMMGFSFSVK